MRVCTFHKFIVIYTYHTWLTTNPTTSLAGVVETGSHNSGLSQGQSVINAPASTPVDSIRTRIGEIQAIDFSTSERQLS